MKIEDLEKAKHGQQLIEKVKKIERQLEHLEECTMVKIFKPNARHEKGGFNFDFDQGNPFYFECKIFIEKYKLFLMKTKDEAKIEFENL
jgi:hypothetical protein